MNNKLTFNKVNCFSPIPTQPFIWMVEYFSEKGLTEFDLKTKKENDFSSIEKDKMKKFGLIGNGIKMFFNCNSGTFNLFDKNYSIELELKGNRYSLNNPYHQIADPITYKRAEIIIPYGSQTTQSYISGYFFGYKTTLKIDDIEFKLKPIISLISEKPLYLDLSISVNKDINITLYIVKENQKFPYQMELKANKINQIHWTIC